MVRGIVEYVVGVLEVDFCGVYDFMDVEMVVVEMF